MSDLANKVREYIIEAGFKLDNPGERAASHSVGMPNDRLALVRTEQCPIDGCCTLVVGADYVRLMGVRIPYNYNDWTVIKSFFYEKPDRLLEILKEETTANKGCW